jgi:hypothetical protein
LNFTIAAASGTVSAFEWDDRRNPQVANHRMDFRVAPRTYQVQNRRIQN